MEITLIWSEINTAGIYLRFYQKSHIKLLRAINEDVVSESTVECSLCPKQSRNDLRLTRLCLRSWKLITLPLGISN